MGDTTRILLVEDLPTDAELAKHEINKALDPCEYLRVETGPDYLEALGSFQPDVIVSDFRMPRFDGMSALKLALEHAPLTPLIILTGATNEDTAVECLKAGVTDYVVKEHIKRLGAAVIYALEMKHLRIERLQAEQALRESEERLRSLYENTTIGLYRTSPDGRILMANPAAVQMLGFASFEELAQRDLEQEGFGDRSSRSEFRRQLESEGVVLGYESAWLRKDGSPLYVRESTKAIRDTDGKTIYYDGTFEDISERKLMEQELYATKFCVDHASVGIMRSGPDARIQSANNQICLNLGYSLEELKTLHVYDIDPNFPIEKWRAHRQELKQVGSERFETVHKRKDGTMFPVEITGTYFQYLGQEFSFSFVHDITQRKQAEERIRRESARAETLLRTAFRLNTSLDLNSAMEAVCEETAKALQASVINIYLYEEGTEYLTPAIFYGVPPGFQPILSRLEKKVLDQLRSEFGNVFTLSRSSTHGNFGDFSNLINAGVQTINCAILKRGDRLVGVLNVVSLQEERWFSPDEQALIEGLADQAAMAISNAILFAQQKQIQEALRESEARYRARTEDLEVLFNLSTRLREAQEVREVLKVFLDEIHLVIETEGRAVLLLVEDEERFFIGQSGGALAPKIGQSFDLEEDLFAQILDSRQPYTSQDYGSDPMRLADMGPESCGEDCGPAAFVPLVSGDEFLGIFLAFRRRDAQIFTPDEVRLLAAMSEMAGSALRRIRLFETVQQHLRRTQALNEIQLTVASSFDLQITLSAVLDQVLDQLQVDAADVLLMDANTLTLEFAAGLGFRTRAVQRCSLRLGESLPGRAALDHQDIFVPNLGGMNDFIQRHQIAGEDFVAYYGLPLITKQQVKGVLEVFQRAPLNANEEWKAFLRSLAGQVAIGIDNLDLFTDLQNSNLRLSLAYDATIEGLSRAMDLRDRETEGHTLRLLELTLRMARAIGMSDAELVNVRRGTLLQDMGKLGIPDVILFKPGKLTEEEWSIIRMHPQYAYDMLSPIEYLRPALDIPFCHHEKWDGTGYPRGLKGAEIPLGARLFAVVDVWDALTHERPYRLAWSREKALAYIREQAGAHFDPQAVDVFLRVLESPL